MIGRSKAKELFMSRLEGATGSEMKIVDKIYDSIGTCETCVYCEKNDSYILTCNKKIFDPITNDFFCADYEKSI